MKAITSLGRLLIGAVLLVPVSLEAIKEVLPKKPSYLLSTSKFDDLKDRLVATLKRSKLQKAEAEANKPTLRKRQPVKDSPPQVEPGGEHSDNPPVLRRQD